MKSKSHIKVIVALSGGVDSAVATSILIDQGYQVEGIFMKNWSDNDFAINSDCPWEQDQKDAESVCNILKIPFRSLNFEKQYREKVVKYFFDEYKKGRTPNPDIICNKEIKFNLFLEKAYELGADFIATGHYARIIYQNETFSLLKGIDNNKDQSYFLHRLNQYQLSKSLFPIGSLTKPQVREIAKTKGLPIAQKKDSQGICFIGKIDVGKFLRNSISKNPGSIVDIDSQKIVGTHEGVAFYTIGQREGIGIGGVKKPYFVVDKDPSQNILYIAQGKDNPALYKNIVSFEDLHFISKKTPQKRQLYASIRYRHKQEIGEIDINKNKFIFKNPQRAVTPGQSIVFYDEEQCLGGAVIT